MSADDATWTLQDAENRFPALVKAARKEPQVVIDKGAPAVVVVDAAEYHRLAKTDRDVSPPPRGDFLALLQSFPELSDDEWKIFWERPPWVERSPPDFSE